MIHHLTLRTDHHSRVRAIPPLSLSLSLSPSLVLYQPVG